MENSLTFLPGLIENFRKNFYIKLHFYSILIKNLRIFFKISLAAVGLGSRPQKFVESWCYIICWVPNHVLRATYLYLSLFIYSDLSFVPKWEHVPVA